MKNKKGFIFMTTFLIYAILIIVILAMLIWFGFRINEGLTAIGNFLSAYWIWIAVSITALTFNAQIRAVVNAILRRFGVKV